MQFKVDVLSEWLVSQLKENVNSRNGLSEVEHFNYDLLTHCTEKSLMADVSSQWQSIFQHLGLKITPVSTGCCGMAGTFGHERKNQQASKDIYQFSWPTTLEKFKQTKPDTLATGLTCPNHG